MFVESLGAGESLRASIRNAQVGENQPDGGKWEVKPSRYQPNGRHMPTKTPLYLGNQQTKSQGRQHESFSPAEINKQKSMQKHTLLHLNAAYTRLWRKN